MTDADRILGKGLSHRVTVYIPSTLEVNKSLNDRAAREVVNRSHRFLANLFGGSTAIHAQGAWVAQSGELVIEQVTLVYAFADALSTDVLLEIHQFCIDLRDDLGQEAIAVEIDGDLRFI